MNSMKKKILSTITLGAFVVGIAGTSMAAAPAAAKPVAVSDYVVTAPKTKGPGDVDVNAVPLIAAFVAGALVMEYLHHHLPTPLPPTIPTGSEAIFDL